VSEPTTPVALAPDVVLIQRIAEHAKTTPDAPALMDVEPASTGRGARADELSYAGLLAAIQQWSSLLAHMGARKDGAVGLLLRNTPAHYVLMLATSVASAGLSLNPLQSVDHMAGLLDAAGADVLVFPRQADDEALWRIGRALIDRMSSARPLVALEIGPSAYPDHVPAQQNAKTASAFDASACTGHAAWFHTGGTTRAPKLVRHSHYQHAVAASAFAQAAAMSPEDRLANGLPLFHVAGAICSTRAVWWSGGCVVNLSQDGFRNAGIVKDFWRILEQLRVTIAGGVPTAVERVLNQPITSDLSRLRCGYVGGAPCSPALQARFAKATGRPLHIIYGMTETCGVIAAGRAETPSPQGVVGAPVQGMGLAVRNPVGEDVSDGEMGEIWVCGPAVSLAEGGALVDGWMATGDQGCIIGGALSITGRLGDMIIRSGHNIDPAMIETTALACKGVAAAAAVGRPDAYAGEVPVLFLVGESDSDINTAALERELMASLPDRAAHPREIQWVTSLPTTAVGKVDRKQLRADAIERMVRNELASLFGSEVVSLAVVNPQGLRPKVSINWLGQRPAPDRLALLRSWADQRQLELL